MNSSGDQPAPRPPPKKKLRVHRLFTELSDSDSDSDTGDSETEEHAPNKSRSFVDPTKLWLSEFHAYIDSMTEELPENMSAIRWWGVRTLLIPSPENHLAHSALVDASKQIPCMGLTCAGLSPYYGVFSLERASIFTGWYHN